MGFVLTGNRSIAAWLRLAGCAVALATAIVLPALRTNSFGTSYRPAEVRQAAARHEYLGLCDDCTDSQLEVIAAYPAPGQQSILDPLPESCNAWRAAMLLTPHPTAPRHLRRIRISSDPCGPPFLFARA